MKQQTEFILASTSSIRKKILDGAGLKYRAMSPINEEPRAKKDEDLDEYLHLCALGKAIEISRQYPNTPVFGCDQVVYFENKILNKVQSNAEAIDRLLSFNGKTHELVNGLSCCLNGKEFSFGISKTAIKMRHLDHETIASYIDDEQPLSSVACYFLEGKGIQLIQEIDGDYFSALGLPLLKIIDALEAINKKKAIQV